MWLTRDQRGILLVIGYAGFIETWMHPDAASWTRAEEDGVLWQLVHSWEHRAYNCKVSCFF